MKNDVRDLARFGRQPLSTLGDLPRQTTSPSARQSRTVTEYRVLSQRTGNAVTEKRYRSLKAVERRIGLLTSAEPWRFYGTDYADRDPDVPMCCPGTAYYECGCGGVTLRQEAEARRRDLPPIEWVRVESRQVTTTSWTEVQQ